VKVRGAQVNARLAPRPPVRRARGVALPAIVLVMVVMGLLVAGGMTLLMQSQQSHVQQLLAARAMSAARSGIEWGLWQVSDQAGALGLPGNATPPCFATTTLSLPAPLSDISLSVSCSRSPASGQVDEGGLKLASYAITAQATFGSTTDPFHVKRQMEARHTVCKNPGGAPPAYRC
jgi:MSHA biogenesis protein MshP